MKKIHLFVSGRVQGVCFRAEMKFRASRWKILGFVKNLEDGRVEAVLIGEEKSVEKMTKWIRRGPMLAKVRDIQIVEENNAEVFKEFKIIY